MNMQYLSEDIQNKLIKNGWYKERKVNILDTEYEWKKDGYTVFDSAVIFLESFNNLKITHKAYGTTERDYSIFNSLKAIKGIDPGWILEDYCLKVDTNLLPIGLGYSEHLTYLIDPLYNFYAGYDDYFCQIGNSVNDFFENIFYRKKFIAL